MNKTFFEKIFSIKNSSNHKVVTILGWKIKFKHSVINYQQDEYLQSEILNYNKELYYGMIFNNLSNNTEWLIRKDFIPTGGAANYSFLFTLLCVLNQGKPKNILEFGIGQTSKLTSQYAKYNQNSELQIIEHDLHWIDIMNQQLCPSQNVQIIQKDMIKTEINGFQNDVYDDLSNVVQNTKYDLIVIDGPYGFNSTYPRTNILSLIPQNLSEDFVIILDDVERIGEQNTMNLIFEKLRQNNITFEYKISGSIKKQLILTSKSMKWLNLY